MKLTSISVLCFTALAAGCVSSAQEQRRAVQHQLNSDEASQQGRYQIAGDEQRNAADSHHRAVTKAISEGQPIPPQTQRGGTTPDAGY